MLEACRCSGAGSQKLPELEQWPPGGSEGISRLARGLNPGRAGLLLGKMPRVAEGGLCPVGSRLAALPHQTSAAGVREDVLRYVYSWAWHPAHLHT